MIEIIMNIIFTIGLVGVGGYKILCYLKTKLINPAAKRIINVVFLYLFGLLILFELDCYNLPSFFFKYNVDFSAWLGYIISALAVLCFNFGLAIYLPEFIRISTKNKELVEDKKYKLICSIDNYEKNKFDLIVSSFDKRQKIIVLEAYKNNKKIKNFANLNNKAKSITIPFTTTIFDKEPEISLIIENNNKKYLVTIKTKIKCNKLDVKDIFFDFYYNV